MLHTFSGVMGMKYEKMLAENEAATLEMPLGVLEPYLKGVQERYLERASELFHSLMERRGIDQRLMERDYGEWDRLMNQAHRDASEMALSEAMSEPEPIPTRS